MNEYLAFEQSRFKKGEIGAKRLRTLELGAKRLMCIANGGKLEWRVKHRGAQIAVSQAYQSLLDQYLSSLHQSESSEAIYLGHNGSVQQQESLIVGITKFSRILIGTWHDYFRI